MKCPYCNTEKKTKICYNRHVALCEIISVSAKERREQLDNSEKVLSQQEISQIVIHLCEENSKLKKEIEQLKKSSVTATKRNIEDYLLQLPVPTILYNYWITNLIVTDSIYQVLLESNLTDAIKRLFESNIKADIPVKAFQQRSNNIYICKDGKWEIMVSEEFENLIAILCHRFLKKYMEWKTNNREQIESSNELRELDMLYMRKANGLGKTPKQRSSEIKKWLFTKLKVDMKQLI